MAIDIFHLNNFKTTLIFDWCCTKYPMKFHSISIVLINEFNWVVRGLFQTKVLFMKINLVHAEDI